jgi:predicted metalloprotease with PDZ domain
LKLRSESKVTLDDVMRALWQRYGLQEIGVPEDGVRRLASQMSGLDLAEFFDRYVERTEELPLPEMLGRFGIDFGLRPAEGNKDKGGKPGRARGRNGNTADQGPGVAGDGGEKNRARQWLGARWGAGDARLSHVFDGGPAQSAGLSAGDVIIAWNGLKVSGGTLQSMIDRSGVGATAKLFAFRRDELMTFEVTLTPAPLDTCWLGIRDDATAAALALRAAWLDAPQNAATA